MLLTQKTLIKLIFIVYCLSNVEKTEQLKGERLAKQWMYHTEYNLVVRGTEISQSRIQSSSRNVCWSHGAQLLIRPKQFRLETSG